MYIYSPTPGSPQDVGTGQYLWSFDSGFPVGIFLPANETAFGADFSHSTSGSGSSPFTATLILTLAGGSTFTYTFPAQESPVSTFFGFTADQPISRIIYDDGGTVPSNLHEEILDNVTYGVVVPEPSSATLIVIGAASLALWRYSRRTGAA